MTMLNNNKDNGQHTVTLEHVRTITVVSRRGLWFVVLCYSYMALDDNDDGIVVLKCIQPLHVVGSCILYCPVFCTDWRWSTVLLCILQGSELKGALQ